MPTCGNAALAIPRISRNQRPTAAFGGAELHMAEQAEADRQGVRAGQAQFSQISGGCGI
jgi:hypothetical protein